jgi:hypothetical protein
VPPTPKDDSLSDLDPLLAAADIEQSPWHGDEYEPNRDLLRELLAVPIHAGHAQQSGRIAKALDAWIAHELRRGGFPEDAVSPRKRRPRMLPGEVAPLEQQIDALVELVQAEEAAGRVVPRRVRETVMRLPRALPGYADANVLGRFYVKQVDVLVSAWQRGPDVLVSSKTMLSSYLKNKNNRYEEAVGEATNLRERYPMAGMGYAYLVRGNVYAEGGAYAFIRNLLVRLRKPDGAFDATMLLVADWDDETRTLNSVEDPAEELSASRFFADILNAVMNNTPVDIHQELRLRKQGEPEGGMPPLEEIVVPEETV